MKAIKYLVIVMMIMLLFACKGKTEQAEIAELVEYEVTDSILSEPVENVTPAEEVKADEAKAVTTAKKEPVKLAEPDPVKKETYKVTFLEIGSVNCIPCRMMQPIMKEIEADYKGIVKVEFYDLMDDREIGPKYNIRVMPTQVFLDANGKEFFRHEGFYPKVELAKMLDSYLAKLPK